MGAWLGPIVSGNIAAHVSWRWFFWLSAIMQGVSVSSTQIYEYIRADVFILEAVILVMVFYFPETKYKRENTISQYRHHESPKVSEAELPKTNIEIKATTPDPEQLNPNSSILGHGYPNRIQRWGLNLRPDTAAIKMIPRDVVTPFQIATYPIVLFAGCCMGFAANCLLVLNLLESPGFSRSPYLFTPGEVGFVNFALMVGGIFGLATAGPFSDWVSMVLTKRNNGIREPEMRLPSFIPFLIIGFIGMLVSIPHYTTAKTQPLERH
jgi:MFS family permease